MKEAKLQFSLRQALEQRFRCLTEKLHGNRYQAGLPDLLAVTPTGEVFFVECKAATRWSVSLLQGRQRLVCCRWGLRGVPVFVVGDGWVVDLRALTSEGGPPVERPTDLAAWILERVLGAAP